MELNSSELHPIGMPRGRWNVTEAVLLEDKPPSLVAFSAKEENGEATCKHAIPCYEDPQQLIEKLRDPSTVLVGEDLIIESSPALLAVPPNGHRQLWGTALVADDNTFDVHAHWYEPDQTIKTVVFHIGVCSAKYAKSMRKIIENVLSQDGMIEEFLKEAEWLRSCIEKAPRTGIETVVEQRLLTPALALACLTRNIRNREVDEHHLRRLCIDLENGNWTTSDSCICFEFEGRGGKAPRRINALGLGAETNGQHRNNLVLQTGKPIRQKFEFGCHPDDMANYDRNRGRDAANALNITQNTQRRVGVQEGQVDLRDLPDGKAIKGITKALSFLETSRTTNHTQTMTMGIVEQYRDDFVWIRPFLTHVRSMGGDQALFKDHNVRAAFLVAHHKSPEVVDQALRSIVTSTGLEPNTALHTLHRLIREYLDQKRSKGKKKITPLKVMQQVLSCLRFHIEGRELTWKAFTNMKKHSVNVNWFKVELAQDHPFRDKYKITHTFVPTVDWGFGRG